MLAEWLSRAEIDLGGRKFYVAFSHEALLEMEAAIGLSALSGELNPFQISAKALRFMLYVLLRRAGATYTETQVGGFLSSVKVMWRVRGELAAAWRAAMPEPEKSKSSDHDAAREKGKSWLKIWADNRQTLGLSDAEWLSYTPRMVQQLSRERTEIDRRHELMLSRIAAATANFGFRRPETPFRDDYFMTNPWERKEEVPEGNEIVRAFAMADPRMFPLAAQLLRESEKERNEQSVSKDENRRARNPARV